MRKLALVTGGAVRLGRFFSLIVSKAGYDLILHYNSSSDSALELRDFIEGKFLTNCYLIQSDFSDLESFQSMISQLNSFRPLHLLINNASIFNRRPFSEVDFSDFDIHHDLHVRAPLFLSQYFARNATLSCISNPLIINICDIDVIKKESSNYFSYLLSKKSLLTLTSMLSAELPFIDVKAIFPNRIENSVFDTGLDSLIEHESLLKLKMEFLSFIDKGDFDV